MHISPEFATQLLAYCKANNLRLYVDGGVVRMEDKETLRKQMYRDEDALRARITGKPVLVKHQPFGKTLVRRRVGQPRIHEEPAKPQSERRREYLRETGREES